MIDFKIRIFQPGVPEYRVAVFNGLGKRYGENIEVWASEGAGQDKSYPLQTIRYDYNHPLLKVGSLCWQRGFSLCGLKRGDAVVICGDVHQISSLWIAFMAKLRGIGVVWWGHHRTSTSTEIRIRIRLAIARRLSDVFLSYTKTGIKYLEERGFKHGCVFATGNTVDQEPILRAIQNVKIDDGVRARQPYVLCCGVLREKMHLELLIKAMADARLANLNLVVIGDGVMKKSWQKLADDLGVGQRITWIQGTRDQEVMAPWFLGAKAFVYPGSIGLSILHSLAYGLPVITHGNADRQMPEFEAMEDGKNGLCFKEGDVEDLADKILSVFDDDLRLAEMSRCAKETASHYTMDAMIAHFAEAIEAAHRNGKDK